MVVSTDVNNVNENNIVYIDQKTSTTSGSFNFNFTLPQNPADVNYGYIIGTDADVDSYIGTISEGQTDDEEEPTTPARTVTCTQTVDGNNVQISGQISDANSKNQVSLVVSTDVNNVNENNIVHIDQTTSTTSGTFEFNFTLPQNSGVSSYGYIIGTDADTETYIGVINIEQSGNEDDDDDDNDHGGDTDITGTTVTVKYYLGADGVFAQTDSNGTSYLFKNGHGDTVTIVRNGNVVDDAEYDAYGNVENPQNITAYTYANYYYDSHSGMYYLRNRFYDSSIARFISEDPIQDGINWYAYCSGNPIAFVDPWGLYGLITDSEDGKVYAEIDLAAGDTLYNIAQSEVGDGNAWVKMGYQGDPGYLEDGQIIDITGIYGGIYPNPNPNAKPQGTLGLTKFINAALNQMPYTEGANNNTPYGKWYGMNNQPWCAMFVSWSANEAGLLNSVIPKYASCAAGRDWYIKNNRFYLTSSGYQPKAGDVFFHSSSEYPNGGAHTGIVIAYKEGYIYTVEGNSNNSIQVIKHPISYAYGFGSNGGVWCGEIPTNYITGGGSTY